jgi:hypothetical protein
LKTLEKFNAFVRVERNDFDFNLAIRKPELPDPAEADSWRRKVIAASRAKYATPRGEVEAALLANMRSDKPKPPPDTSSGSPPPKPPTPPPSAPSAFSSPKVSEPVRPTEVPKAAEVPKAVESASAVKTNPPMADTPPPATRSGKEKPVDSTKPSATTSPGTSEPKESRLPGRGKARHKNIQKRIKDEATKLGFSAESEKQLAKNRMEAADVVVSRGHIEIAVEVALEERRNHEFENVQKCLKAGFSRIAVVSTGRKTLDEIAEDVQAGLRPEAAAKVGFYTADEFLDELRKLAAASEQPPAPQPMAAREIRHGIEIERSFPKQTSEQQKSTQKAIHQIVSKMLKSPPPAQ